MEHHFRVGHWLPRHHGPRIAVYAARPVYDRHWQRARYFSAPRPYYAHAVPYWTAAVPAPACKTERRSSYTFEGWHKIVTTRTCIYP